MERQLSRERGFNYYRKYADEEMKHYPQDKSISTRRNRDACPLPDDGRVSSGAPREVAGTPAFCGKKYLTAARSSLRAKKGPKGIPVPVPASGNAQSYGKRAAQKASSCILQAAESDGRRPKWGALTDKAGKIAENILISGWDRRVISRLCREYYVSPERVALCLGCGESGADGAE
jgi:hypothetical protein